MIDPTDPDFQFEELPSNNLDLQIGCLLYPTNTPLCVNLGMATEEKGESGMDFIRCLGGNERSFVVILGSKSDDGIVAGCVLTDGPPTAYATWDFWQLVNEVNSGVWRVVDEPDRELGLQIFQWLGIKDEHVRT